MSALRTLVALVICFSVIGCGPKRIKNLNPNDPLLSYKNEFYLRYNLWVHQEELEALDACKTKEEVDSFVEKFWNIRDTDPTTKENEYKIMLDERIDYVERDSFIREMPIIMNFNFKNNGGTRGDMGKIFLLLGKPNYVDRLSEGTNHLELMVWYYIDDDMKPRYAFLFYNRYGRVKVFSSQSQSWSYLLDPNFSPLKEISTRPLVGDPEQIVSVLVAMLDEIALKAGQWEIYIGPMMRLSYYDDINRKGIGGVFEPPIPASILAEKYKPIVFGKPNMPAGSKLVPNVFNATIPMEFQVDKFSLNNQPRINFNINYRIGDLDWLQEENGYFASSFVVNVTIKNLDTFDKYSQTFDTKINFVKEQETADRTLRQLPLSGFNEYFNELPPGRYSVDFYVIDNVTKKYSADSVIVVK